MIRLITWLRVTAAVLAVGTGVNAAAQTGPAVPASPPVASGRDDDPTQGVSFALDIADDEAKAQIAVSGYLTSPRSSPEPGQARTDWMWKLAVSTPVSGSEDNLLEQATLDKLGNGTKISGQISLLNYRFERDRLGSKAFLDLMDRAAAKCIENAKGDTAKVQSCKDAFPAENFVLTHTPSARLAMNRSLYSGFFAAGLKGSVSFDRFDFVTPGTLAENTSKQTGYSATLWGTYYPSDGVSAWKVEAEYSDAAEGADEEIICKAVVVVPNDDCTKAAPVGPTRKEALVLRGEYRRYFPFGSGKGGIGASLTGSVDTLSGDYGFELPVYFTIPGVDAVAPGIKVGYASKEKDWTVGLFIKTAFSF